MKKTLSAEGLAAVQTLADWFQGSRRVLVITGAGLSADSGLPTYRGIGGLYNQGMTEDGVPIETALSGRMLAKRPALCWKYIYQIEAACRGAQPNRGHRALAALESHVDELWVLTQNVDGFHQAAGSSRIIPIHGDVHYLFCTECPHEETVDSYADMDIPPACPSCRGLVRPRVVLFGEMLPAGALNQLEEQVYRGFDLVLSVGTTSVFPYITAPVLHARMQGNKTVEINPGSTEISDLVDLKIPHGAAAVLGGLWDELTKRTSTG